MKNEIIRRLALGPVWLKKLANELNVSYFQILDNCPTSIVSRYPIDKVDELFELFCTWDKVTLVVQNHYFTAEINDYFPKGEYGKRCYNMESSGTSIGGHLKADKISHILLVKDFAYGRYSFSAKFFAADETPIFSVYLPRDKEKRLIKSSLNQFLEIAGFCQD